jgi:hypothetical protein
LITLLVTTAMAGASAPAVPQSHGAHGGDSPDSLVRIVRDATESNQAVYGPVQIRTANATNRCGGPGGTVTSRFAGRARRSLVVRFGKRRTVAGQVLDAAGRPVGGASVRVLVRVRRRGERWRVAPTPITARPGGVFRYRTPRGPSRSFRFAWRAAPAAMLLTCSRALRLGVRAAARLRAVDPTIPPGGTVRLRGVLRGGHVPGRGKVVDLQAFDGGRWRTFDTVRARGRRFRASYRFSPAARGTYPMRVRIRPDGAYPFALGHSSVVRVRVG